MNHVLLSIRSRLKIEDMIIRGRLLESWKIIRIWKFMDALLAQ